MVDKMTVDKGGLLGVETTVINTTRYTPFELEVVSKGFETQARIEGDTSTQDAEVSTLAPAKET